MSNPNDDTKIIHLYFNPDHIDEVDDYVNELKKQRVKNSEGRQYSRNDYFLEAAEEYGKKLGLLTSPRKKSVQG